MKPKNNAANVQNANGYNNMADALNSLAGRNIKPDCSAKDISDAFIEY
jgi:hypothetical protein